MKSTQIQRKKKEKSRKQVTTTQLSLLSNRFFFFFVLSMVCDIDFVFFGLLIFLFLCDQRVRYQE